MISDFSASWLGVDHPSRQSSTPRRERRRGGRMRGTRNYSEGFLPRRFELSSTLPSKSRLFVTSPPYCSHRLYAGRVYGGEVLVFYQSEPVPLTGAYWPGGRLPIHCVSWIPHSSLSALSLSLTINNNVHTQRYAWTPNHPDGLQRSCSE